MRRSSLPILTIFPLLVVLAGCSDDDGPGTGPPLGDTSPPSPVTDLAAAYEPLTGAVFLSWTAPRDDDEAEGVSAYEIRLEYTDGYAPAEFWETSGVLANPPEPGPPGSRETCEITDPRRARDLYVGVLAVDEAGNRSAASGIEKVRVAGFSFGARCVDVFTGLPVEGLRATLSTGESWEYATGASGGFSHQGEIDNGLTHIEVRTGEAQKAYHAINETIVLVGDSVHTFYMIPVEPVEAPWAPNLLGLFNRLANTLPPGGALVGGTAGPPGGAFAESTAEPPLSAQAPQPRILAKWRRRPVACYIPPFVNESGVDYALQATLAAGRWMEKTGKPLFEFVDAPPDTGIVFVYKSQSEMGGIAFTRHTFDAEGHPLRDEISIVREAANAPLVYKVFLHELGHTIPLGHTDDMSFIMFVGQPLPGDISNDESRVVRLHASLPVRIDMAIYDESSE
jgi:hypothetical protein